jgi:hypothetical protein
MLFTSGIHSNVDRSSVDDVVAKYVSFQMMEQEKGANWSSCIPDICHADSSISSFVEVLLKK